MVINDGPSINEELLIFSLSASGMLGLSILVAKGTLSDVNEEILLASVRFGTMGVDVVVRVRAMDVNVVVGAMCDVNIPVVTVLCNALLLSTA